jgi:ATP-binding cassette subfamily B protein
MAAGEAQWVNIAWPAARLGELIENLARRGRLASHPARLPQAPPGLVEIGDQAIGRWIDAASGHLGLETEAVDVLYADLEQLIRSAGPLILRLPGPLTGGQPLLVGLVRGNRSKAFVLAPNLKVLSMPIETLRAAMCSPYENPLMEEVDRLLQDANIPETRRPRSRRVILQEQLGPVRIQSGWLLRLPAGAGLWAQLRQAGAVLPAFVLLALYLFQQLLMIASWFVLGRGVFSGHFDWGWILAWAILLLSTIPLQILVTDAQSELSMRTGVVFKQRLLEGTLKLEPEEIRHQGMGQFLGRVMESEAVEMLGLSGGFMALLSFIEIFLAILILNRGAGGTIQAAVLAVWVLITLGLLWRYYQISREWTETYRAMTNDLVERMVGHRTRLAQEDPRFWHDEEDQALDGYFKLSEALDRAGVQLNAFTTRGWIAVGLAGMALPFISGAATAQQLAISLGGVLLAAQGLAKLSGGAQSLVSLLIAWGQVGPLFNAASRPRERIPLDVAFFSGLQPTVQADMQAPAGGSANGQPLLLARDLTFRYRQYGRPAVQEASLKLNRGDRVLLEGPSGGGKSTLAALLTGLRSPESGSLLLWGFDRQLLGSEEWRRHVVMAPQFQENHVFADTFAFNLLMGRRWPPRPEDLQEAEAICRELGLGEVMDRMPSGFQQILGESGWQLSHGEKSRLFIARTLLQNTDLIILDESFAALDPENLYRSLRCVLDRAQTLLVIAHP